MEDNVWYLAKILEITKKGTINVVFTEYGNTQECTEDLLRPLTVIEPKKTTATTKTTTTTTQKPTTTNSTTKVNLDQKSFLLFK